METLRHPDQATLIYDIFVSWEQNIADGPKWLGGYPPVPTLEKRYPFLGHDLVSPITIAAGPASGEKWTDFYFRMGYGMVMEKTRRTVSRRSNPLPNVVIVTEEEEIIREALGKSLQGSMDDKEYIRFKSGTNSFGNPCDAMYDWAARLRLQKEAVNPGQLLGCSVTATLLDSGPACASVLGGVSDTAVIVETASDMLIAGTAAVVAGADLVEFNLACPNVTDHPEEGEMFQSPELVRYLFSEWHRRFPKIPAGMKGGLYADKDQMRRVFAEGGDSMGFVSLINAVSMEVLGKDGNQIVGAGRRAGTFGSIIRPLALEEIEWAAQIRVKEGLPYGIIGGGGITSVEDVDTYLSAGADVVFIAGYAFHRPEFAYDYRLYKS